MAAWDGPLQIGVAKSLLGRAAALSERYDEAHEWFRGEIEHLRELAATTSPARMWLVEDLARDVEALVALGDIGAAAAEVEELVALAPELPPMQALVARSQGLLAAARRQLPDAQNHLRRSLELLESTPSPWLFEIGGTLFALGKVQRSARQKRAARESFERALEIFEHLGARLWVDKARAELGRISGRPSRPGALTAMERRVAELVAGGHSNAEVARELFLSPKTVEWNLSKVYKKLHVRSRTELAAKLSKQLSATR